MKANTRAMLAWVIVAFGLTAVTALGLAAILTATDKHQATQLVFASALPLFGTWVGTVLAFYFAKENLEAATQSTLKLTGLMDDDTSVESAMTKVASIDLVRMLPGEALSAVPLSKIHALMLPPKNRQRVPVLDGTGAVKMIVHEATIERFATGLNKKAASLTETAADLAKDPDCGPLVVALAFVPKDATIGDARRAMKGVARCNDVFVTASGQSTEPMLGWLTSTKLATQP